MWKRYLAWVIVTAVLASGMPIMSYASEGADMTWDVQEQAGEEISCGSGDVLENGSSASEGVSVAPDTVSGCRTVN